MLIFNRETITLIITLGFLLFTGPAWGQTGDVHVIWTQRNMDRHSLNLKSKVETQWGTPAFIIEESANPIIVPTISMDRGGDMWIAWTELDGDQGRLRYRIKRRGRWAPVAEIVTVTSSDMAPSIIIDHEEIAWMVWSGTDETDDDIYFSRWMGDHWQEPERVNENDLWPDILPSISMDSQNRITVSWLGFNGDCYVGYSAFWTGRNWSNEQVEEKGSIGPQIDITDLPEFIPQGSQGCWVQRRSVRRFSRE